MKAIVLNEPAGIETAALKDQPVPSPQPGEVRVAIKAASLNHRELWIGRGQYPGMKLPSILGADGAGVIEAVGEGVDQGLIGQDVVLYPALNWGPSPDFPSKNFCLLGMPVPGTLAEYICVPADSALPKPGYLSFEAAAAFPTASLTAFRALTVKGKTKVGDKVLITGIGGGVATFALKFAVAMGAEVYVTSGNEDNIQRALSLGAKDGFDYKDEGWGKAARAASGGFDVVIDGAPAASYAAYGRALNYGARIVLYGSTSGVQFSVNAPELFLRHATVFGTAMGNLADFAAMLAFSEEHRIEPVLHKTFALEEISEAFAELERNHFGKIVVRV
ncbi:quinone oxidoreductase family protein [Allorhizobium pseudoryzae]|jgi:NADPH:quinone reductase-like Zn-dependent oxidoreductase|uniref:quinone oxidoreductase family protein n=1 Tax=Allorhizobium pseudoryzae TaxID=379684 RepID=UPI003D00802D